MATKAAAKNLILTRAIKHIKLWSHMYRAPLISSVIAFFFILLMIRVVLLPYYGQFIFERMALYQNWLWLILLAAMLLISTAFLYQNRHGEPQYFPVLAWFSFIVFISVILMLIYDTAADWSEGWSAIALVVLTAAFIFEAICLCAYAELWREIHNRQVVDHAYDSLQGGSFRQNLNIRTRKTVLWKVWGSLHCLRTLQGYYDEKTIKVLKNIQSNQDKLSAYLKPDELFICLKAGETMSLYLSELSWPEKLMFTVERDQLNIKLYQELITLHLINSPEQRLKDKFASKLEEWTERLSSRKGPYWEMLNLIFELGSGIRLLEPDENKKRIRQAIYLFEEMAQTVMKETSQSADKKLRSVAVKSKFMEEIYLFGELAWTIKEERAQSADLETCANSWLALAHHSLHPQACLEVWNDMRRIQKKNLFVSLGGTEERDLAKAAAIVFQSLWYAKWSEHTHQDWNQLLAGRATYAQGMFSLAKARYLKQV